MSQVSNYTPTWLSRPSPGFKFFNNAPTSPTKPSHGLNKENDTKLSRTIARRGTEIFTVVNNELRWSDLLLLKESWEVQRDTQPRRADRSVSVDSDVVDREDGGQGQSYRVLKVPVSRNIRQIVISPGEDYLAIITSHTAHVAVLPDTSHLYSQDMSDLKLKTFQLGPTMHVMERSPIAAVRWHPLGAQGNTLVTITADAVVRLWELDRKNRWSFDVPALDFDLRKLADGRSAGEDFSPSKYGTSKGFSPDSFEMDVASATFGGTAEEEESPWSAMTMWVAMKTGDIYALCPLLPSKWQAPPSLTASLSTSIQCHSVSLNDKENASKHERMVSQQRLTWIADLEKQQQQSEDAIVQRPLQPGSIPKLQGPFQLAPDPDQIFDITDIHVVSPTVNEDSQASEDSAENSLFSSLELVCVATSDAKVHVCANLRTPEGSWLPIKRSSRLLESDSSDEEEPELLVIESINLTASSKPSWPVITPDSQSRNSIFVTLKEGVFRIDLKPLTNDLLDELNDGPETGIDFRVGMLVENSRVQVDHLIDTTKKLSSTNKPLCDNAACVDLVDPELGHFLLAIMEKKIVAATLTDTSVDRISNTQTPGYEADEEIQGLITNEPRPSYQPPEEFWSESMLASFMEQHVHSRGRRFMSEDVLFSSTTLNLLMEAHRVLSHETHRLGVAAADLFSRCERLQDEFRDQIVRAREVAQRVDGVLGDDADLYEDDDGGQPAPGASPDAIVDRLEAVGARHEALTARHLELRRKVHGLHGRALSDRERAWTAEVETMDALVAPPPVSSDDPSAAARPAVRFRDAARLKEQLVAQARELGDAASAVASAAADADTNAPDMFSVAPDRRRARLAEVNGMLERQAALVDATRAKLERLDILSL